MQEQVKRIQAVFRGHSVRCSRIDLLSGHSKWYTCNDYSRGDKFVVIYNEFLNSALRGEVSVFVGFCDTVKLNVGTVVDLLEQKRILCSHSYDMKTLHIRFMHPCKHVKQRQLCNFGYTDRGNQRIRPMPQSQFKNLGSDLQSYIVRFMDLSDYWAFSLVSRNIYFDGRCIYKQMQKLAGKRLGFKPLCVDIDMRGYSCLRKKPRPLSDWLLVSFTTSDSIVGSWRVERDGQPTDCLTFVTKHGKVGKVDLAHGNTQTQQAFRDPHNHVMNAYSCNGRIVLRREWGFTALCEPERHNWLTVRINNLHELAISGDLIFFVAGSQRQLSVYNVETRECTPLPHLGVQMLKKTPRGVLFRVGTKQLVHHCDDCLRARLFWGAERRLRGLGRIAMISEPLVSGNNIVLRALRNVATQAVVMRERHIVRIVDVHWPLWLRRDLAVAGDMLTFRHSDTHKRMCVRPDRDEWTPTEMCVGDTDGDIIFCQGNTVFVAEKKKVLVLPRWA